MKLTQVKNDWAPLFSEFFQSKEGQNLERFISTLDEENTYPRAVNIFKAFELCPLKKTKVIILGQDPYHGPNQAHGLAFSVPKEEKIPPSLRNIYKELHEDLNLPLRDTGDLTHWAKEGVLLLNTVLTVEPRKAGSHQKKGWEQFTDFIIKKTSDHDSAKVFILWGSPAQKKERMIDSSKHLILKSPHPSPLSSYRGFFGSQPFSKTNEFLAKNALKKIKW